jgi:endo-beta-N-acetylglucosaminidase D
LERSSTSINFEKSSIILNEILNHQRSQFEKTGLHYNKGKETANEEASTSSKSKMKKESIIMLIHSETLLKLKTTRRRNYMFHRRKIPLMRMESRILSHQDGITQPCIKTLSLTIVIHVMDLVIKQ